MGMSKPMFTKIVLYIAMNLWIKLNLEIHLILSFFKSFSFHDVSQFGELQMIFFTFLEVLIESLK